MRQSTDATLLIILVDLTDASCSNGSVNVAGNPLDDAILHHLSPQPYFALDFRMPRGVSGLRFLNSRISIIIVGRKSTRQKETKHGLGTSYSLIYCFSPVP